MKKLFPLFILFIITTATIACKKDSDAPEAEIKEPVEAKEVPAASNKYLVDVVASTIDWAGSKPTGRHTGTIKLTDGQVFVKDSILETGKFTIDMKSITVTDLKDAEQKQNLENHLKGLKTEAADHFFNTNKFPTGVFEITGTTRENDRSMIEGNLTLKGITKNIKFPAVITITDNAVTLVSDSFKINRTLWNINYSSKTVFENLGNEYVSDDIELKINMRATK
jgi:polyisoprenoid-binding protein YceI